MKHHFDIVHNIMRCNPQITYLELLDMATPHLKGFMSDEEIREYVFEKFIGFTHKDRELSDEDILWARAEKQAKEGNPNLLFHLQDAMLSGIIFYVGTAILLIFLIITIGKIKGWL